MSKQIFNIPVNNQIYMNFLFSKNYTQNQSEIANDNNNDLDTLIKHLRIEVRGHEDAVLNSYTDFIKLTANGLDLKISSIKKPYRFIERWSILKSKFVHKKHFVQYEMRTHFRIYEFKHLTGSTCSTLLEYIQRNLPAGVSMYVTKTKLECLPDSFTKNPFSSETK